MVASLARVVLLATLAFSTVASANANRVFEFSYEVSAHEIPVGQAVDIYIPRPSEQMGQRILATEMQTDLWVDEGWEQAHGNGFYHFRRPANSDDPLAVIIRWRMSRASADVQSHDSLAAVQRERYLSANTLVPVGHPMLKPILAEIHQNRSDDSQEATARAIYDWVVDNVEYKKIGSGWGNGDTYWACNERYGNCTDFHALYISLARSEGIPARFEIGFPVPTDRSSGVVGGYHCWVQLYLPGQGWLPIDASEAAKNPENREQYYGEQPNDRIHFTIGRDLTFSVGTEAAPLNYFIYPHIEVAGKPWLKKVETRFHYREIEQVSTH